MARFLLQLSRMTLLRRWILCGPVLLGVVAYCQTVSFLPPAEVIVSGSSPYSQICAICLATADFNGDGNLDIVYSFHELTPFAGVLLGNGDGTFRPGFTFNTQELAMTAPVAVGDFNGDGKPDVVLLSTPANGYLGNGDGTFSGPFPVPGCDNQLAWPDGTPNIVNILAVADVNRDGRQDLICGPNVLLSRGDGSFAAVPSSLDGDVQLAADFNNDGNPDLLLIGESGRFAVVLGRGDGTFGPDLPVSAALNAAASTGYGAFAMAVQAGDFNGDGRIDLAGISEDGTVIEVLPGKGDGSFGPPVTPLNLNVGVPGNLTAVADFNRDGKLDLMAGDAVLLGNGDGTFRFPIFLGVVSQPCNPQAVTEGGLGCDYTHPASVAADFNNDGLPDLAAGYSILAYEMRSIAGISAMLNDSPGNGFTATGALSANLLWPVAPGSIVSAFGVSLAPATEAATAYPWPTTLGGIRLHVRDRSHAAETLAPLLYVSPGQINYLLLSTDPFAWVSIERVGSPYVPQGVAVPLVPLAPGLYSLPSGLAAATAVTFAPDGTPVELPGAIDLSGPPVYLSLYGTGFDAATNADSSCSATGLVMPATYAGPQGEFPGLDQVNVLLPKSLAGTGAIRITCSFGNPAQTTDPVTLILP